MNEAAMLFVELAKAIAWPCVIFFLGRQIVKTVNITGAISRLISGKLELPGGVKAEMAFAEQRQESPTTKGINEQSIQLPTPSPAIHEIEERLKGELKKHEGEMPQGRSKEDVLLRALAISNLRAGHEFTYNRIFGSQIAALKQLNSIGSATVEQAREFFRPYAEMYPQVYGIYGFDGWFSFLKNNSLIIEENNILRISGFGKDFLIHLAKTGLTENKLF